MDLYNKNKRFSYERDKTRKEILIDIQVYFFKKPKGTCYIINNNIDGEIVAIYYNYANIR